MRNLLPCAVLGLALIACDLEPLDPETATERGAQDDRRPPPGAPDQAHAGPKGPPAMMLVGVALHSDILDDEQHADLEPALDALQAVHRETRATHDAIRASGIDGVAVGRLDPEDHAHALDVLTALAEQEAKAMEHVLVTLHALLDPAQRSALVDAVARPPAGARGAARPEGNPHRLPGVHPEALRRLAEAIALSDDQITEIRDALPEPRALPEPPDGAEVQARLAAFASPDFDPSTLALTTLHPQHVRAGAEGWLTLLAVLIDVIDVIDDEQRDALVEHLLERENTRP